MIFCCRKKLILGTILAISIANLDVINCCSGGKKSTTNGPNPTTVNPDNKEPDGIGDSGKELVLSITIWGSKIVIVTKSFIVTFYLFHIRNHLSRIQLQ